MLLKMMGPSRTTGFKHKLFELRALKSKALLHKAFLVSMLMSCAQ
jgi:hypothetical protein